MGHPTEDLPIETTETETTGTHEVVIRMTNLSPAAKEYFETDLKENGATQNEQGEWLMPAPDDLDENLQEEEKQWKEFQAQVKAMELDDEKIDTTDDSEG